MTIDEQLEKLKSFMTADALRSRINAACSWIGRDADIIIPSTSVGIDGVNLLGIFVKAGEFFCEVNLQGEFDNFDVIRLSLFNIRVTLGIHQVKQGDEIVASYHTGQVSLFHTSAASFNSLISYAGLEPATDWLRSIREAFPPETLLQAC